MDCWTVCIFCKLQPRKRSKNSNNSSNDTSQNLWIYDELQWVLQMVMLPNLASEGFPDPISVDRTQTEIVSNAIAIIYCAQIISDRIRCARNVYALSYTVTHLHSSSLRRFRIQHFRISINLSNLLNLHMIVPCQQYLHMEIDLCLFIFRILDIPANHVRIDFFFFVFCVMNCTISVNSADFGASLEKFNKFTKIEAHERVSAFGLHW